MIFVSQFVSLSLAVVCVLVCVCVCVCMCVCLPLSLSSHTQAHIHINSKYILFVSGPTSKYLVIPMLVLCDTGRWTDIQTDGQTG